MPERNIDNLIDWNSFYSQRLNSVTVKGDELVGSCPFHSEKTPSFTVNLRSSLWNCFGCNKHGNGLTFLEEFDHLSAGDAAKELNRLAGISDGPVVKSATPAASTTYTVGDYSVSKKLPMDFLNNLGIKNGRTGITIPYYDEARAVVSSRQRYGDSNNGPRFTWTRGSKVHMYGLWFLKDIRKKGYVVLVEGESDCHTLWLNGVNALGIPGASVFQNAWVDYLKGVKVYIFKEPDVSGDTFVRKLAEAFTKSSRSDKDEVLVIKLLDHKDPSELWCADPDKDRFKEYWTKVIEMATVLDYRAVAGGEIDNAMPDAPVRLRYPSAWIVNNGGIFMLHEKTQLPICICRTPVLITRRLRSRETDQEKVEVAFRRDNKWQTFIVERSVLFQSRSITSLADWGVTVTSENAKFLVRFLADLEAENIDLLERTECVTQLGWHGDLFIPGHEGNLSVDVDFTTQKWYGAYYAEGNLTDWCKTINPFRSNSIFRFILAASFAAPLLKVLGHRIFIIHNWGESRSGKTACLKAALSPWGNPEKLLTSFYATRVGIERLAGFFCDLPLGIDEKQVSGETKDFMDNLAYMISLGSTMVRGTKTGGLQAHQTWKTIALTTGEEPLTRSVSQSGMYSRILEIYGAPFKNEIQAQACHALKDFGFAGPEFVGRIIKADKDHLQKVYEGVNSFLSEQLSENLGSHVSSLSIVAVADALISHWFFGEETFDSALKSSLAMAKLIGKGLVTINEVDIGERGYEWLRDWLLSNTTQFHADARNQRFGYISDGTYFIYPQVLKDALEKSGYSYRMVMKLLRARGCFILDDKEDKRFSVVRRFGEQVTRFVAIKLEDLSKFTMNVEPSLMDDLLIEPPEKAGWWNK